MQRRLVARSPLDVLARLARLQARLAQDGPPASISQPSVSFSTVSSTPPSRLITEAILSRSGPMLLTARQLSSGPDVEHPIAQDPACDPNRTAFPEEPYALSPQDGPYGFFPMRLGQSLRDGQYEVVRKLGWGIHASVWLARENMEYGRHRYVAIKVLSVIATAIERLGHYHEVATARDMCNLQASDRTQPGYQHCANTRLFFYENSVHGTHACMVYPAYGTDLERLLDASPARRFPLSVVKNITRQVLLGLSFLHDELHRAHTDVKLANILVGLRAGVEQIDDFLANNPAQTYPPLPGVDVDPVRSEPLPNLGLDASYENLEVSLTDYGNAIHLDLIKPDTPFCTPSILRAPEQLLGHAWSKPIDVWAVGCLISELLTSGRVFDVYRSSTYEEDVPVHIAHIHGLLGPFPMDFVQRCTRGAQFIDSQGIPFRRTSNSGGKGTLEKDIALLCPDLSAQDLSDTCRFLRRCLTIDPLVRPSASELLADTWLAQSR